MNKIQPMTKPRKVLRTTDQVIAAFRGTARCAERWDRTQSAVSQWRQEGIPPGYHYRMMKELEATGYIIDGKALGWL